MKKIIAISTLLAASFPAFSAPTFNVPEPGMIPLLGLGLIAISLVSRKKK